MARHSASSWSVSADGPSDVWRELCWRYVTYPAVAGGRPAHPVFAMYLRQHRPAVQAALVDSATGTVLPWPPGPAGTRIPLPRLGGSEEPAIPALPISREI
jgi:hypothetical protein